MLVRLFLIPKNSVKDMVVNLEEGLDREGLANKIAMINSRIDLAKAVHGTHECVGHACICVIKKN